MNGDEQRKVENGRRGRRKLWISIKKYERNKGSLKTVENYECRHSYNFQDTLSVNLSQKVVGSNNPRIFNFPKLYIASKVFSEGEILSSGKFGHVYRALLLSDYTIVVVQCLSEKGEQFEKTFTAELMAVAQLCNRNIVRLRGCVFSDSTVVTLNRSLRSRKL
ncbi:hypothetical protein NE237_000004 [Protea cynaroides]|uniref:non-specific serine/threonine protein kinase n=1 Tax=Protea cynaroides TaxID=273540 RepID=A0A9Q0JRY3_9MAGN|nr:hypothetical protein NE237_000004 [Protea cynaroides]